MRKKIYNNLFLHLFSLLFICSLLYLSNCSSVSAESSFTAVDINVATSNPIRLVRYRKDASGIYKLFSRIYSDTMPIGVQNGSGSTFSYELYFDAKSAVYEVYYDESGFATSACLLNLPYFFPGTYSCGGKTYNYKKIWTVITGATESEFGSSFDFKVPFFKKEITLVDGHNPLMHKLFGLSNIPGADEPENPLVDAEYNKEIGYPLKFYYTRFNIVFDVMNTYKKYHKVTWKNRADGSVDNCKLQLQFKGTYKVRKNIFSKVEKVNIDYFDIDELDIYALQYKISSLKFDFWDGAYPSTPGIVYRKIVEKIGYEHFALASLPITTFRARYVREVDGKVSFGPWVECTVDEDNMTLPVVTDNEGKPIETPDYPSVPGNPSNPDNPSYDNEDKNILESLLAPIRDFFDSVNRLFDALKTSINALISNIGQVPALFMKILSFLPQEIWGLISVGIGIVIILRVLGR